MHGTRSGTACHRAGNTSAPSGTVPVGPVNPRARTLGRMSEDRIESQWWYNDRTRQVEQGLKSPNRDHIGPFATREEAEHALDTVARNNRKWDEEDAES